MKKSSFFGVVLCLSLAACAKSGERGSSPVSDRLGAQLAANGAAKSDTIEYVARFESGAEANAHVASLENSQARVTYLDSDRRIQKVAIPRGELALASVSDRASVTVNTGVRIALPREAAAPAPRSARDLDPQAAIDFLTARGVVGVERLRARFPAADGRNAKVAVFDTGIDFGIQGIETDREGRQKLLGFYDFSGFGRIEGDALAEGAPQVVYAYKDRTITVASALEAKRFSAIGAISEAELARKYLTPASEVDLNGDGDHEDSFLFLVGQRKDESAAVWIDANQDGILGDREREEFTDYNTTRVAHSMFDSSSAPNGARPLAVTLLSPTSFQVHSVHGGHGTGCATIIAADGYANGALDGMAPKAKLLAYTLDIAGQDVYTIDQFLAMFLHARDQGVDAISISWGFATADLQSARFVADFLDKEIASRGILIGIAAGNAGPSFSSAIPNDYIPHHGFSVGAMVSRDQAVNVYGLLGIERDLVVDYSGFGLTAGGRENPDLVSPLMTMVRGNRTTEPENYFPFGGTSSATPALIGASSALVSALKENRIEINARILKLALQNTATPLDEDIAVRQGAGLLDVNAAYETYVRLLGELKAAMADPARRTPFPVELRANARVPGMVDMAEGVELRGFAPGQTVAISLTEESLALVNSLEFTETLFLEHSRDFFAVPNALLLQSSGASFAIAFDAGKTATPGTYSDVIRVRRADGTILLRIPVVLHVPTLASAGSAIAEVSGDLSIYSIWRMPVRLESPAALAFDGTAFDPSGSPSTMSFMIKNTLDQTAFALRVPTASAVEAIQWETPVLPAGNYEVLAYPTKRGPGVVAKVGIRGFLHLPQLSVAASEAVSGRFSAVVRSEAALQVDRAKLVIDSERRAGTLARGSFEGRAAFLGELDLVAETDGLSLSFHQSEIDSLLDRMLHVEAVILDASDTVVYRGWINLANGLPQAIQFARPARQLRIVAFPNIVNWDLLTTQSLALEAEIKLAAAIESDLDLDPNVSLQRGQLLPLSFALPEGSALPANPRGKIEITTAAGKKIPAALR